MKRKCLSLSIVCVLLLTVAGCNKDSGAEYVGNWKKMSGRGPETRIVEKHGDVFVIRQSSFHNAFLGQKDQLEQVPAMLKDGALQIETGMGAETLVIDKTTGHLLASGAEYERAAK